MNNASFIKRMFAYIVDICLISILASLIYTSFDSIFEFDTTHKDILTTETAKLFEKYQKEEITYEEYVTKAEKLSRDNFYEATLENIPYGLIEIVVTILYATIMCYYMKGRTLGKKFFNIKIVDSKSDENASVKSLIIRSVILFNLYSSLIMMVLVFISRTILYDVNMFLTILSTSVLLISGIMMLFNKDRKAIHDYVAKTKVVSEI